MNPQQWKSSSEISRPPSDERDLLSQAPQWPPGSSPNTMYSFPQAGPTQNPPQPQHLFGLPNPASQFSEYQYRQQNPSQWVPYGMHAAPPNHSVHPQALHPPPVIHQEPTDDENSDSNKGSTNPTSGNGKKRKRRTGANRGNASSNREPAAAPQTRKRAKATAPSPETTTSTLSTSQAPSTLSPQLVPSGVGPIPVTPTVQDQDNTARSAPNTSTTLGNPSASAGQPPASTLQARPANVEQSSGDRSASDCWAFLRPLETNESPEQHPDPESERELRKRPPQKWVGCKLCRDRWTVWVNNDGMTSHYRKHLAEKHREEWVKLCGEKSIPIRGKWASELGGDARKQPSTDQGQTTTDDTPQPFTQAGFLERLIRWIVSDDQSVNVIENPFFRELLRYVSNGSLGDKDIPHRSKVTDLIKSAANFERQKMEKEMQSSEGRISFTSDLWSDPNLTSYMAVTAHYFLRTRDGRLVLRSRLCAFHHITGRHTGANLGKTMVEIFTKLGVVNRLGCITLDNASNCDSLADQVAEELEKLGIGFTRDQNRLRCFPHVVNLAVQDFINNLASALSPEVAAIYNGGDLEQLRQQIEQELFEGDDIVHRIRGLVAALRVSGQRREAFKLLLIWGNKTNLWANALEAWRGWWLEMDSGVRTTDSPIELPVLQLLRDCPTRWSSTYLMIHRFLELYPAINQFINSNEDLTKFKVSRLDIERLINIHHALSIPHAAQQLLSFESTPTLSLTLPIYESLVNKWEELMSSIPELQIPLSIGVKKIKDYINKTRQSDVYILAMALNPTMKLEWMEQHWDASEVERANMVLRKTMMAFRLGSRRAAASAGMASLTSALPLNSPTRSRSNHLAARSQSKGLASFLGMSTVRRTGSLPSISNSTSVNNESRTAVISSEAVELANDELMVNAELLGYTTAGTLRDQELENFDLVRFWEVHYHKFPILSKIAMDVLPVQASSVPCERIFSSSKETTTLRRNRLSPELMEALQVLKHTYHQKSLDFASHLVADAGALEIDDGNVQQEPPDTSLGSLEQLLTEAASTEK